jgi:hypothetical protein
VVAPTLPMLLAVIAALMGVESGAAGAGGRAGAGGGIVWVLSRQISWREPARLDAAVLMGSATPDSRRCVRTGCNRYQLPPVKKTPTYTAAAALTPLPDESLDDTWARVIDGANAAHNNVRRLLSDKFPYDRGGWVAYRNMERCIVLKQQMRSRGSYAQFLQRVRSGYTRDAPTALHPDGELFARVTDARQGQRGHGAHAGRFTRAAERRRTQLLHADAKRLAGRELSRLTAAEHASFGGAPVVTPRNLPMQAIVNDRVRAWARTHNRRLVSWTATDYVAPSKAAGRHAPVTSVLHQYGASAAYAVSQHCASGSPAVKVPHRFFYADDLPMCLTYNEHTHCGWTNGTLGVATRIHVHPAEPPDDGRGEMWELQHEPLGVSFRPNTVLHTYAPAPDQDGDALATAAEFVIVPRTVTFEYRPSNAVLKIVREVHRRVHSPAAGGRGAPKINIRRRNFAVASALCVTDFKVRSRPCANDSACRRPFEAKRLPP